MNSFPVWPPFPNKWGFLSLGSKLMLPSLHCRLLALAAVFLESRQLGSDSPGSFKEVTRSPKHPKGDLAALSQEGALPGVAPKKIFKKAEGLGPELDPLHPIWSS